MASRWGIRDNADTVQYRRVRAPTRGRRHGSEMDAVVKGAPPSGALPCHGTPPGARRPARRQRQLVTLRFAGLDRMAVSGRELPRTWVAGWCRREPFEDAPAVDAGRLAPGMARSGSDGLLVHDLL